MMLRQVTLKKELILQDFMDVEYIPLETKDDFICQGLVLAIGKDIILARNRIRDGDIFIYDRKTGKGLKKINREGQGGEEYTFIQRIVLDEKQNEIFVLDHFSRKISVYDLDGNFKRSLKRGDELYFFHLYNFNQTSLITNNYWVTDKPAFTIISKQDGTTKQIQIPFKEKISMAVNYSDKAKDIYYNVIPDNYNPIIPYFDCWVLVEQSSDTVYKYQSDHKMIPIIARTPSVQSMNPEVFLFLGILTNRYYFMETVKKIESWVEEEPKSCSIPFNSSIKLTDVNFSYENNKNFNLKDINLEIKKGEFYWNSRAIRLRQNNPP